MVKNDHKKPSILLFIILAGEAVFFLPFVMARIFRPTLLTVFEISNTELGAYFSVYGVVAMVSYLFGGTLADRFPARNLMALALWLTAGGGVVMSVIPAAGIMIFLYGFWGFTTIFLFWAAMIRATREWGGEGFQGRAFGWLEGGRGGTAALIGTIVFILFSILSPGENDPLLENDGLHAFQWVIIAVSIITFLSGILVWYFVPVSPLIRKKDEIDLSLKKISALLKLPTIWLLAIMIVAAYSGYKITDDFALYAREVLNFSEVGAAAVGTGALWVRAIVAIIAGSVADRYLKINIILICFALSALGGFLIASGLLDKFTGGILINLSLTMAGIYGLRALYFAILREAKIPVIYTGTAVGIVSFVGYTPEIFMGPWMGYLLDRNPGIEGHQDVFWVLFGFGIVGLLAGGLFRRLSLDR